MTPCEGPASLQNDRSMQPRQPPPERQSRVSGQGSISSLVYASPQGTRPTRIGAGPELTPYHLLRYDNKTPGGLAIPDWPVSRRAITGGHGTTGGVKVFLVALPLPWQRIQTRTARGRQSTARPRKRGHEPASLRASSPVSPSPLIRPWRPSRWNARSTARR
jgi:hypothetical protein